MKAVFKDEKDKTETINILTTHDRCSADWWFSGMMLFIIKNVLLIYKFLAHFQTGKINLGSYSISWPVVYGWWGTITNRK